MSDLQRLQDAFLKADERAQAGDAQAAQDARAFAQEIRRLQAAGASQPKDRFMGQVNAGISDAVGGLVDFINPFDKPHALNPFPEGTGSARTGLNNAMLAIGADVQPEAPTSTVGAFARGSGQAAGALLPVAGTLNTVRSAGGMVGSLADDAYRSIASTTGVAAETAAGGISEAARFASEQRGDPQFVQDILAIAAPVGVLGAGQAGLGVAKRTPGVTLARQGARSAAALVAPYTERGGREVARRRMRDLAGGPERAEELADMVGGENPLNLTPAQQTNDPNMLGLENLAADQNPLLREALERRAQGATDRATAVVREGAGEVDDARDFFTEQRAAFSDRLNAMVQDRIARADRGVDVLGPQRTELQNSVATQEAVRSALDDALVAERQLWDQVPRGVAVQPRAVVTKAESLIADTVWAQDADIPRPVRQLLERTSDGQSQTVAEMHGLYSELRRVARSAMAGNDQNKNMARIANEVADAILEDLGASDPRSQIGQAVNAARLFSAELHETFDRGAVGKILQRTLDGDTTVEPELALRRTVARGDIDGAVAARQITEAAPSAEPMVQDVVRGMFTKAVRKPDGEFDSRAAARFNRDNADLLQRFPELRKDIADAVRERDDATAFAARVESRLTSLQSTRKSTLAKFIDGPPEKAIRAVLQAQNPVQAAAKLSAAARKDPSGAAMAGLKDAFSSELIGPGVDAQRLMQRLNDRRFSAALARVYSPAEISRMRRIAVDLAKVQGREQGANIGTSVSGAEANKLVEYLARIVAARQGAQAGGATMAGGLQGAQMASSRAKAIVDSLVSDKASQILTDAITDPELFKLLLTDAGSQTFERKAQSLLLPYLIGTGAAVATEEQPQN